MTLELQSFLPYRLSRLINRISRQLADEYDDRFDINIHQWRIIAVLGQFPGLTASKIAQITAMEKVSITRAVQDLVKRSILYREASEKDGRLSHLHLAPQGQKIYKEMVPIALWYEHYLIKTLRPEEKANFNAIFLKLEQAMTELEKQPYGLSTLIHKERKKKQKK